jgi:colanic acid/amylovoran biosynthesis glycosyltransferase
VENYEKKENNLLLLFTSVYPYGEIAESFLDPEISHLSSVFEKVVVIPRSFPDSHEMKKRSLPENVEIENTLIQEIKYHGESSKTSMILKTTCSIYFYKEIFENPSVLFNISSIKKLVFDLSIAYKIQKWILNYIESENLNLSTTVFYTYWLSSTTFGISLAKKKYPTIKLISRAHRNDLYSDQHSEFYHPFRSELMKYLNKVFLISEHGKNYILKQYPLFSSKYKVSRLGVKDPSFLTKPSDDHIFRIISCSYLVPVKRIELLIKGLEELGRRRNEIFEWTHIGYGPLQSKLEESAASILPNNIKYKFVGYLSDEEFKLYYENNCVDVFINVSASEGIPVSLMEAQSYGIPIIATKVGGNPEIVSDETGILISETPEPKEIAEAIETLMKNPVDTLKKRIYSRKNWEKKYNADKNFNQFAAELKIL